MSNKIKSGLVAAFFLLYLQLASASAPPISEDVGLHAADQINAAAKAGQIYKSPVWSALLHASNGHPNIADANFLLSLPNFSLESELRQTIDFLYRGEQSNVCRFPARYLWLRKQLDAPELPLDECKDIVEFRQKAPLDEITLVFASETIAQPASMLGHAFLKFSGKNAQGQQVSHAISFYTDADTINLPKLLFDSLVIGKKGYFSLSPYNEKQQLYVDDEQRNLWEYQLALDSFQKELIRLHLHELKQSQLIYFFHRYNCATLLDFILQLSGKSIPDTDRWVTPKDLIKHAQQAGLIADTRVITPSHWLVRTLADQVTAIEQQSIKKQVQSGTVADGLDRSGSESAFIRLELARAYNQHAYLKDNLDKRLWLVNDRDLAVIKRESFPDKSLNTDNRYNPINTPGDSQIALAIQHDKDGDALSVTVIPVSHTLNDDNRNYASETSLQLLAPTIKIPLNNGRPKLDRLTIYDMQSLSLVSG